ncbi:MAG: glycoside hydrolase family 78 protein [Bacteroidales bacterium]|nr:glycoside hydrolase family 78 protein [Bacteroidales bacterium]
MKLKTLSAQIFLMIALAIPSFAARTAPEKVAAVDLKAERQVNPIGIDYVPQLSWRIESDRNNCLQKAYRVIVSTTIAALDNETGDIWDSGKVVSDASCGILPEMSLVSRQEYFWKVKVWSESGVESEWSEPASFEAALVNQEDWYGGWIGYVPGMPGRVLYFKASANVVKPVLKARAYVAGLGYSDVLVNRKKVGDHVLDPSQCTYTKRVYYVTHDIAPYLQEGGNTIVIPVAPGWLGTPRLRAQVEIFYTDGTYDVITTDSFRNVKTGPTVYSTVFDGEKYDAREDDPELWEPFRPGGLMNKKWAWAHNTDDPVGRMMCERVEPIKIVDVLAPKLIAEPAPGVYVFDAGRNLAGWVAFKAHGAEGDELTIKFAENCYENGFINQENLRNAKVTDTYVFKGDPEESWEPSFTYHGFRYFQVEGLSYRPAEEDFAVKVVRTSVEKVGTFESSSKLLNDIYTMISNTESNNLHSVPTDCPQRDERMGWLNDMTVRIETAMYGYDLSRFYSKFIQDVTDTQDSRGTITCVAPFRFGMRPADPVSASYLIMAQKCYEFYGDVSIIRDNFDGMKGWVDYLRSRTDADGCVDYSYYGDWCEPAEFGVEYGSALSGVTPGTMMSTGYLYYCEKILGDMAAVIGKADIAAEYHRLAEETAKAYNKRWFNPETGGYAANNQAANCFALWLGLVEPGNVRGVVDNLVAEVVNHDYHLTTGNLCTKYLLEALTENGHVEEAYRIASQETYPSWGYMLANGATALWERWENLTGDEMNSHDHPMMGSAGSWFIKYLVGIRPDFDKPGFSHFTIKPYVPKDLSFVNGSIKTVKGNVVCNWSKKGKTLTLNVEIPAGAAATVEIPSKKGYTCKELGSGKYTFTSKI